MRKELLVFFGCFSSLYLQGQDIHFSQFYHAPSQLNPAYTGSFDGDVRLHASHRTQWNSISPGAPFRTFGFFADATDPLKKNISTGLSIYHDKTGDSQFSTLQVMLTGARKIPLNADSVHWIGAGILLGFSQRSIDYNNLRYTSQYNGSYYDPNLPTGEAGLSNGYLFLNSGLGILYQYQPDQGNISFEAGIGLHNILKPRQSFDEDKTVKLDRRLSSTLGASYTLNARSSIHPKINMMLQGTYSTLAFGTLYKYKLEHSLHEISVVGGLFGRASDAGFVVAGIEYDNVTVGLSYDINLSSLTPASQYRGGFELSLVYVFRKFRPWRGNIHGCPAYI